ncbi:hypothetical protein F4802DRAFT_586906 [Xylaria palmicola]|nr:hypothetical protein F4802DRAFT_586906 [Xylaria palmicola]
METSRRKREISSCIPCYTRKQKCNRRYPCDHCTRRRRPEQCAYYSSQSAYSLGYRRATESRDGLISPTPQLCSGPVKHVTLPYPFPDETTGLSTVARLFGYSEGSKSNTLALVQRLGISAEKIDLSLPDEVIPDIQEAIKKIPAQPVLDSLLQYFVAEVSWFDQLIYPPWLLAQYQKWWDLNGKYGVIDIEFSVLFLRICWYASLFIPPEQMDSIKGVALVDVRGACDIVANSLESICNRLDERGSLIRVQYLAFAAFGSFCHGRMNNFWASLSRSVRVAQRIGMHLETTPWDAKTDQFEREMSRRTFCSLYVMDSILSFRMDHIPLFPSHLQQGNMPQMHLVLELENSEDAPDMFAERILQVKLVDFWKRQSSLTGRRHGVMAAQERYENFCNEFLPTVPPVFALEPDTQWDSRLPKLGLQRLILHMSIFDSLCYNFRSALLHEPGEIEALPEYKRVLLSSHKRALASAALGVLVCVSTVHDMMGGLLTRHAGIIISTFEAAVFLLCLCADSSFPGDSIDASPTTETPSPLSVAMAGLSRYECIQAARDAVNRLQAIAELSKMAEVGARALASMIARAEHSSKPAHQGSTAMAPDNTTIEMIEAWTGDQVDDIGGMFTVNDVLYGTGSTLPINWEDFGML